MYIESVNVASLVTVHREEHSIQHYMIKLAVCRVECRWFPLFTPGGYIKYWSSVESGFAHQLA